MPFLVSLYLTANYLLLFLNKTPRKHEQGVYGEISDNKDFVIPLSSS